MTTRAVKQALADDISDWFADGVIEQKTLETLRERYQVEAFGVAGFVRYLGIAGGLIAFFGIMGMIAAMSNSVHFGAVVTAAVGCGLVWWGIRLAGDIRERYATSSKIVLTLGAVLWTSGMMLFAQAVGAPEDVLIMIAGTSIPVMAVLAYKYHNSMLLLLSVASLFHWVGAWNGMLGRSTYGFHVQDPRAMSVFALLAFGVGVYHELRLADRTGRFYKVWESLGLLYLNMSLLILSIWRQTSEGELVWSLVLAAATVGQILLGARLHNGMIRGFGVVFFAINVFTRYHEAFWDRLELGSYLLLGGLVLLALGGCMEGIVRAVRMKGAHS
ncbi:MAG TPA: hypothetical protein PLQ54_11500 [Armatimonadota bacterium]|nr:hypothetical protein [Armatimonadota bacterium]